MYQTNLKMSTQTNFANSMEEAKELSADIYYMERLLEANGDYVDDGYGDVEFCHLTDYQRKYFEIELKKAQTKLANILIQLS